MDILLVEDDYLQSELISEIISNNIKDVILKIISTEFEFRSRLEEIVLNPPNLIIMDIMLRWTDADPDMPEPPAQIEKEGFYHAGFRCQRLLSEDTRTKNIPVLLYTILGKDDLENHLNNLPDNIVFFQKDIDTKAFIDEIKSLLKI